MSNFRPSKGHPLVNLSLFNSIWPVHLWHNLLELILIAIIYTQIHFHAPHQVENLEFNQYNLRTICLQLYVMDNIYSQKGNIYSQKQKKLKKGIQGTIMYIVETEFYNELINIYDKKLLLHYFIFLLISSFNIILGFLCCLLVTILSAH